MQWSAFLFSTQCALTTHISRTERFCSVRFLVSVLILPDTKQCALAEKDTQEHKHLFNVFLSRQKVLKTVSCAHRQKNTVYRIEKIYSVCCHPDRLHLRFNDYYAVVNGFGVMCTGNGQRCDRSTVCGGHHAFRCGERTPDST